MKIKLHNSMCKVARNQWFLFDHKIFVGLTGCLVAIKDDINSKYYFLAFEPVSKNFREWLGFGNPGKYSDDNKVHWWKELDSHWKEMSEEDENQITQLSGKD